MFRGKCRVLKWKISFVFTFARSLRWVGLRTAGSTSRSHTHQPECERLIQQWDNDALALALRAIFQDDLALAMALRAKKLLLLYDVSSGNLRFVSKFQTPSAVPTRHTFLSLRRLEFGAASARRWLQSTESPFLSTIYCPNDVDQMPSFAFLAVPCS